VNVAARPEVAYHRAAFRQRVTVARAAREIGGGVPEGGTYGGGAALLAGIVLGINMGRKQAMRTVIAALTIGIIAGGYSMPARAVGCFTGGLAGAVAGHMAHHGVLGAVGGCIAGHAYHKHQKTREMEQSGQGGYSTQGGYGDQAAPGTQRNTY
jgi:hypothetical protein